MSEQAIAQAKPQSLQTTLTSVSHGILQRCSNGVECEECRKKRESSLQRAAVNAAPTNAVPLIVHDVLRSPGQPLDAGTRTFMESRFAHDFSVVRIHTDERAAESARSVNALAYTVGRDVVFGTGQYTPGTMTGKRLLAHELTHVVQQHQKTSPLAKSLDIDSPDHSNEREANYVAAHLIQDSFAVAKPHPVQQSSRFPTLQRQPSPHSLGMRMPPTPDLTYHPSQSVDPERQRIQEAIRRWLKANTISLRGLSVQEVKNSIISGVPESKKLPSIVIEDLTYEWASENGIRFPSPPKEGVRRTERLDTSPVKLNFSGLKLRSVSTGHSVNVGADGVTVETPRGKINVSWTGTVTLTQTRGPVHVSISVGPDSWKIDLSIPLTTSTPRLDTIQAPLGKINSTLEGLLDDLAHSQNIQSEIQSIEKRVPDLKAEIDAITRIAATRPGVNIGVTIGSDPGPTGGTTSTGIPKAVQGSIAVTWEF